MPDVADFSLGTLTPDHQPPTHFRSTGLTSASSSLPRSASLLPPGRRSLSLPMLLASSSFRSGNPPLFGRFSFRMDLIHLGLLSPFRFLTPSSGSANFTPGLWAEKIIISLLLFSSIPRFTPLLLLPCVISSSVLVSDFLLFSCFLHQNKVFIY